MSYKEPSVLLRIANTEELEADYRRNQLKFSCAANWINYEKTKKNHTMGDYLEGVFGHVVYPFNFNSLVDKNNHPVKDKIAIDLYRDNNANTTLYLRYEPTILMPTICFFGISLDDINQQTNIFEFLFSDYAKLFNLTVKDSSVLLIDNLDSFKSDLIVGIIKAVEQNYGTLLTNNGFARKFSKNTPYMAHYINYYKYNYDSFFIDNCCDASPLFAKCKDYEKQSEFRIVINNIHFTHKYSNNEHYNHRLNTLYVTLPNLHKYSRIFSTNIVLKMKKLLR